MGVADTPEHPSNPQAAARYAASARLSVAPMMDWT